MIPFPLHRFVRVSLAVTGLTLSGVTDSAPTNAPAPRDLLRTVGQFTDREWAAVARGESVARVIDTDSREVAVVGAVRVAGSPQALLNRYRDLRHLRPGSAVLDVKRLGADPHPSDFASLPLEDHSLYLRDCRPGDCQVRLSAADVERFHRGVDWRSPDWRARSAAIWREVLCGYAVDYMRAGRHSLPEYVNKAETLRVADEVAHLVRQYAFIADFSPEFYAYLQEFGPRAPAGSDHALYWTKEDLGIRHIVRISHQVVYEMRSPRPVALIATNQVYADHYLDAALGVVLVIPADTRSFYLISVNRARTRSLSGLLRRLARATVQSRSRDGMQKILNSTKALIENGS